MSEDRFIAELELAALDAEMNRLDEKSNRIQSAIRWEEKTHSMRMTLMIMLESAQLDRKELAHILFDIGNDGPEELLEKIRYVSGLMPEPRNPRQQFKNRVKIL